MGSIPDWPAIPYTQKMCVLSVDGMKLNPFRVYDIIALTSIGVVVAWSCDEDTGSRGAATVGWA